MAHRPATSQPGDKPAPAFLLDAAWHEFNLSLSSADATDRKANNILQAAGVVLTLLVTLRPAHRPFFGVDLLFVLQLVLLIITAVLALMIQKMPSYSRPPDAIDIYSQYIHSDPDVQPDVVAMLIRHLDAATKSSRRMGEQKARLLLVDYTTMTASLVMIAARAFFSASKP
jgi:hypothetical protein